MSYTKGPYPHIYLQVEESPECGWCDDECTWCKDKINDSDIKYVLADSKTEAASDMYEALKEAREVIANFPHSFGYEFTHLNKIDDALSKAEGKQ